MTGEQLFLRHVWPDAGFRFDSGQIDADQLNELQRLMRTRESPTPELLEACFAEEVQGLRDFVDRYTSAAPLPMWRPEVVRLYWREFYAGPSPVLMAFVDHSVQRLVEYHLEDGVHGSAFNIYRLQLQPGEAIIVRQGCVIEKVEE